MDSVVNMKKYNSQKRKIEKLTRKWDLELGILFGWSKIQVIVFRHNHIEIYEI